MEKVSLHLLLQLKLDFFFFSCRDNLKTVEIPCMQQGSQLLIEFKIAGGPLLKFASHTPDIFSYD